MFLQNIFLIFSFLYFNNFFGCRFKNVSVGLNHSAFICGDNAYSYGGKEYDVLGQNASDNNSPAKVGVQFMFFIAFLFLFVSSRDMATKPWALKQNDHRRSSFKEEAGVTLSRCHLAIVLNSSKSILALHSICGYIPAKKVKPLAIIFITKIKSLRVHLPIACSRDAFGLFRSLPLLREWSERKWSRAPRSCYTGPREEYPRRVCHSRSLDRMSGSDAYPYSCVTATKKLRDQALEFGRREAHCLQ